MFVNTKIKSEALSFAINAHNGQTRKVDRTQLYISHPIAVAKILERSGCDDHVVAAGYLHDVVEDTKHTIEEIELKFGHDIADLVSSASEPDKTLSWAARKQHTIELTKNLCLRNKFLICADKIHNISSMLSCFEKQGVTIFESFNQGYSKQLWYYESLYDSLIYDQNKEEPLFVQFHKLLGQFKQLDL